MSEESLDQSTVQHLAALLIDLSLKKGPSAIWKAFEDEIYHEFSKEIFSGLDREAFTAAISLLNDAGVAEISASEFAGDWIEISCASARYGFDHLTPLPKISDKERRANLTSRYPIIATYFKVGEEWVNRVESALEQNLAQGEILGTSQAPASDRIVTLDHNQISDTSNEITKLLEAVEEDNGDPEQPGLRERLIGQIKAGRELVRSGEIRAYLLYEVLVTALNEILEKYGNETIKELARALLAAILGNILAGS